MIKSMRQSLLCLCAIMIVTAFSSCSKDGSSTSASKTQLLTKQLWKIDQSGVDADQNGTIDIPDAWEPCQLDNTFLFKADGSGVFDEGATKCNDTDPQTSSFVWIFKTNETILSGDISQLGFSGDANIAVLNSTSLEVYKDITLPGSPIPVRYVIKFKH